MRGRGAKFTLLVALAIALLVLPRPNAVKAQNLPSDIPALISADQITYDENLGVVNASGNVEISQNDRVLLADSVSYNLRTNVVTASGNVSLMEPTGEVIFANFVELTDDMREGFIRDIRILLTDRSRLAAISGLRTGGNKTVLTKAVFSPCQLCRDDPIQAPLWQLKALEIEHDQEDKMIRYRDAWMEIYGVPVFYTPYFEHPDPTVKRKSGFLSPIVGGSEVLGTVYQQPYFWAIDQDKDVTIAPIFTTKQGVVAAGEYRHLFTNGTVNVKTSGTVADREESDGTIEEDRFRGHVDATARFDINKTWRAGLDAQRATDDTYLRIYNFSSTPTLTSRAFAEGFNGRNYLAINNYTYQGLRIADNDRESPIILPMIDYNYMSDPGIAGGKYTLDANFLALTRIDGRDSRRASMALGWELPYTGPAGDVYNVVARVQGDGYWVNGVNPKSDAVNPSISRGNDLTGRVFPQLAVQWRYPWVRHGRTMHQVIEPIVQAVVAPNGGNPGEIPNEDSLDFEFDDTNLFSLNRFTGIDRVTSGTHFDYGLKWTVTSDGGGSGTVFIGESYRLKKDDTFAQGSGLEDNLSDIVGRVEIKPTHEISLLYRFRLDEENLRPRRNELDLRIGPPALNLSANYLFLDSANEFVDREELNWRLSSRLTQHWSAFGGQRIDLEADETRDARIGLTYRDECFMFQVIAQRTFFSDREIKPEDSIFFNVVFKHLGGLTSSQSSSSGDSGGLGGFGGVAAGGLQSTRRAHCPSSVL